MKTTLLFLLIFFGFVACNSADKTKTNKELQENKNKQDSTFVFVWMSGCCENSGAYDGKLYDSASIENTHQLINRGYSFPFIVLTEPKDLEKINFESLDSIYQSEKNHLSQLKIIPSNYWKKLQQNRLRELKESYQLLKTQYTAFFKPDTLLQINYPKACSKYVAALTTKDTSILFKAWKELRIEMSKKNGDPNRILKEYKTRLNSSNNLFYAHLDLIIYGFYNTFNQHIFHHEEDGKDEKEFEKLFSSIKSTCDDCD